MSDYKLEFTLRQHTPLIHFQHDQEGATLRATEVKAKLDRFLCQRLIGDAQQNPLPLLKQNPVWRTWLIGGSEAKAPAFDYKINILDLDPEPEQGQTALITRDDIGFWKKSRKGLKVKIFTYHLELKSTINECIHSFFALNNFGKRQSKAWGSFFPTTNEALFSDYLLESGKPIYEYNGEVSGNPNSFYARVTEVWRLLKSGKNVNNDYRKALVFKYASEKGLRWDKRRIKKDILSLIESGSLRHTLISQRDPIDSTRFEDGCDPVGEIYSDQQDNPDFQGEYRFVRAMLGLPELYEFQAGDQYIHQVSFSSPDVERFKSPVTFKVCNRRLFAILDSIPESMFSKSFSVSVKSKPRSGNRSIIGPVDMPSTLITPSKGEFDLEEFMDKYFQCLNFERIN